MRWILAALLVINVFVFGYISLFGHSSVGAAQDAMSLPSEKSNQIASDAFGSLMLLDDKEVDTRDGDDRPKLIDNIRLDHAGATQAVGVFSSVLPKSEEGRKVKALPLCTLVGKFSKLLFAEYFVEKLVALDVRAEVKNLVVSSQVGFWLHLPPQPSRKQALRLLAELQRQGVDSYVIPTGNLANGISLGMFSQQNRAENVRESILKLGYRPEILTEPRERKEVWVFLSQAEAVKISTKRWSELLSGKNLLEKRQILCSDVASA